MPLTCPHCQMVQADGSRTCLNCGGLLTPERDTLQTNGYEDTSETQASDEPFRDPESAAFSDPLLAIHARRDAWKRPALFVVVVFCLLGGIVLWTAQRKPSAKALPPVPPQKALPAVAATPDAVPVVPPPATKPVPPQDLPLTLTLSSAVGGRHVKVGEGVRLTTFTNLTAGQSASLTLTYRRNQGKPILFSFAQGSLSGTTWTPTAPGHYDFLATALDDRQRPASARHLQIIVDPDKSPQPLPSVKPAPSVAAVSKEQIHPLSLPTTPVVALPPKPIPRVKAALPQRVLLSSLPRFYVAAAHFPRMKNAVVLADALHNRGYHALPEKMTDKRGKAVYAVITGSYSRPAEARKAVVALQQSGYPAYFFRSQ